MLGNVFYVYEHYRPDTGACFYVGKGKGKRAWDMRRGRNRWHKFIAAKLSADGLVVDVRVVAKDMDESAAFELERLTIAAHRAAGAELCNTSAGGEGPSGIKHTDEWRAAASARMRGRKLSDETRKKLSLSKMGNKNGLGSKKSAEAIERTAAAHRGAKRSDETRLKIRMANLGKKRQPLSAANKERLRLLHLGKKRSEETRAKMRKPKSQEHKRKLAEAARGKTHSPEVCKFLSENARKWWDLWRANAADVGA